MVREEEEAMNDDSTNIYSCSDSDNNRIGDDNLNHVWGTWEELVLTYAVKRHGFGDWDSVSKEVRSRCSLNASPENCSLKYVDLKRRFHDSVDGGGGGDGERNSNTAEEDGEIPWMEELRSLRVAELRREVERYDDSILSLQLKVKRLEEENRNPDLEDDSNTVRSPNNEIEPARINRETSESDRYSRSMNESNSTASVDKSTDHERKGGDKIVQACENSRNPDPDPVATEVEVAVSKGSKMSRSAELGESGTSTGRGKKKGGKNRSGEDSSIGGESGGDIKLAYKKSQPLIEIIELIRSHPSGSLFESRLRSQETKKYKSFIKQHLDIKMIEKKLEKGSYVSSNLSFYRDLKLLFTNAIVYFPPSSSESVAAKELRTLVSNEIKKQTGKSGHSFIKAEAESSVSRQKSSLLPLVVCKKKSSASKKTTSPSSRSKQKDEEKTVTRRTSKGKAKKPTDSKTDSSENDEKEEIVKTEKKMTSDKKKSVADFLKRIKKNSPQKETTSKVQKKNDENKSKIKPMKLRSKSKVEVENNKSSSKKKQPKKEVKTTGKRSRDSEEDNKQPKKRNRR